MSKMPRNHKKTISVLLLILLTSIFLFTPYLEIVNAQGVTDLEQQIEKKKKELSDKKSVLGAVEGRIEAIKSSNSSIQEKIKMMTEEIEKLKSDIETKDKEVQEKIKEIESKQGELMKVKENLDVVSGSLYVETRNKMANFIFADWKGFMQNFYIRKGVVTVLKEQIEKINGEFSSLADARSKSEKEKEELDQQKKDLDDSYALLAEEKTKLQAELSRQNAQKRNLTVQIGGLTKEVSQLQQFLLYAKSGGTVVDISMIPTNGKDVASMPDYFRQNAPAGSFGVFSFGAYTWRTGLSQYGADVRALLGQNYQQILSSYYSGSSIGSATIGQINVRFCDRDFKEENPCSRCPNQRFQSYDFETQYMPKIAEMPDNFAVEALKAQAVSARTYAIWRTNYGTTHIDADECDQAFNPNIVSKPNWESAVSATKDQVLTKGGVVFKTSYAAVHGGYSNDIGWDSIDGSSSIDKMYETKSTRVGSYWFYRQWFRSGYAASGADCGHTAPWLSNAEMADILNGHLRLKSVDTDPRVIAIDINKCWGKKASPYSHNELSNIVPNPVTQVYSVITYNSNKGKTEKIVFNTNRGLVEMTGTDFKTIYSLRAPAYFRIPQNGSIVHINIETK